MTQISDIEDWIVRTGLRDRTAFDSLYNATSAKLFGVCLRVLNNRAEAEEVLQEAYVRVWQRADRFAANGYSPMTWLITLTRNLAIDRLRARKAPAEDISDRVDIADAGPTPEQAAVATSERARIDLCLDALDDPKAGAVRGAYLLGETYDELAARYAVPVNTMRTWLRRSLLKLRECLTR
ncbi:MAG: sigma-70 family RNA polymerase sigma factor [Pseudomonadota bacterium]